MKRQPTSLALPVESLHGSCTERRSRPTSIRYIQTAIATFHAENSCCAPVSPFLAL